VPAIDCQEDVKGDTTQEPTLVNPSMQSAISWDDANFLDIPLSWSEQRKES